MSVPERIGTWRSAGALRPAEARVDVDDLGAALPRAHRPAEADRVRLSQVRTLDKDAVRVLQILLETGGATAPERGPRPGTVLECHMRAWFSICTAPIAVKDLRMEVVLLVIERRTAEVRKAERAVDPLAVLVLGLPPVLAGRDHTLGDHVHRRLEIEVLPVCAARAPIADRRQPARLLDELTRGRAFWAQRPWLTGDRGLPSISTSSPPRV